MQNDLDIQRKGRRTRKQGRKDKEEVVKR